MRSVRRTTATAAATAVLAATATVAASSAASAASITTIGKFRTSTVTAAHVRAGSTLELHSWFEWNAYRRTSHDLAVETSDLSLWNPRTNSCRGTSVSFFNPLTRKWQAGQQTGWCTYTLNVAPLPAIWKVPTGQWAQFDIRVTFLKQAAVGDWKFMPQPSSGYGIINRADQGQFEDLSFPTWPVYTTRVFR